MTLDEAIKHAEEVAEEQKKLYRLCPASESGIFHCDGTDDCKTLENGKNKGCLKCAEEHRQLAEWLKELKQLREQTRWISVSEELPDKEGYYLCSVRYMYPPYNFFEPEKVKYMDDVTIQKFDGEFNIEVKAWMPLPTSFEPQERSGEE